MREDLPSENADTDFSPTADDVAGSVAEPQNDGPHDWTLVARFAHVAEAGYFADVLSRDHDVPTRVHEESHFEPLSSAWRSRFGLLVPDPEVERASAAVAEHLSTVSHEAASSWEPVTPPVRRNPPETFDDATSEPSPEGWRPLGPVVLAAIAAACGFLTARWVEARPQPPARGDHGLWAALAERPQPWVQLDAAGRTVARLQRDPDTGTLILEVDRDGDGRADLAREFQRP